MDDINTLRRILRESKVIAVVGLSADWFRALAETTATAIFVYGVDQFHYANRAAEELTGYSMAELRDLHGRLDRPVPANDVGGTLRHRVGNETDDTKTGKQKIESCA